MCQIINKNAQKRIEMFKTNLKMNIHFKPLNL